MANHSSAAEGGTLERLGYRGVMVQVLLLTFLCTNLLLIVTLLSNSCFYTRTRYILFTVTLFSDSLILFISDILFLVNRFKMHIALCVPIYILVLVYTFVTPLTLTAMTLECYVAICLPLRHGELCTTRRTLHCILIIHGLSLLPVTVILSVFFISAPPIYYSIQRVCSMDMFVFLKWQDNVKLVLYQVYFLAMAATICFSFIKIMKAARAASREDKKSEKKALRRVSLHGFHLLLCLVQLWCPFIDTAVLHISITLFIDVRVSNYILFYLSPKCLSPLIYGLWDEKILQALKKKFLSWRQEKE